MNDLMKIFDAISILRKCSGDELMKIALVFLEGMVKYDSKKDEQSNVWKFFSCMFDFFYEIAFHEKYLDEDEEE